MYKQEFQQYIEQKRQQHGSRFDASDLAPQFVPYFTTYREQRRRIEVSFRDANGKEYERKRGTVGITTGWKPAFLLMLTSRSIGSSYLLRKQDVVIGVKTGKGYATPVLAA